MAGVVTAAGLVAAAPATSAAPVVPGAHAGTTQADIRYAGHRDAVPGRYVVVLKGGPTRSTADGGLDATAIRARAAGLAERYGGTLRFTYTAALAGFAVELDADRARKLAADPAVDYVAQDLAVAGARASRAGIDVFVQPNPPSWGLDRVDQRSLPLDAKYHYPNTAQSVRAYIIDTGIRFTHQEFGGRAVLGVDLVGDGQNGNDCNGHGTFMAGTVGGRTVGLAKQARLIAVRVLNCAGSGTFSAVVAGVDFVTSDSMTSTRPSVANMSLGGGPFQPLDDAVTNSIAANVHYSVAAGGSNASACNFSPARVPRATTVGATDGSDNRAPFSNFGPCLDVFAPGVGITSAWATGDSAYVTISGTSPSAAHATGTAALWRQRFPADNADQVAAALAANATPGVVVNPGAGSPNLLLFMGMIPM